MESIQIVLYNKIPTRGGTHFSKLKKSHAMTGLSNKYTKNFIAL